MKLFFILLTFFLKAPLYAQTVEVYWTEEFKKEVHFYCPLGSSWCEEVCKDQSFCEFKEGLCKNCIGTGLKMNYLLSELGKTINNSQKIFSKTELKEFLLSGNFSTLAYRDVFNVIDGFDSLRVLRKFESLCPEGSFNQIIFLELTPLTRDVKKALLVYCEFPEEGLFYHLSQDPVVEVYEKNYP